MMTRVLNIMNVLFFLLILPYLVTSLTCDGSILQQYIPFAQ